MKLMRILSGVTAALMTISCVSSITFAAEPTIALEALDAKDFAGNAVSSLSAGDAIIVPIDATCNDGTNSIWTATFELNYDPSVLTLGIDAMQHIDNENLVNEYGNKIDRLQVASDNEYMMYGGRDIIKSYNALTKKYVYDAGQFGVVGIDADTVRVTWSSDQAAGYKLTDIPEFYVYFTVNDGVSVDANNLNASYINSVHVISAESSTVLDTPDNQNYAGTSNKLNECLTAFKVSVDSAAERIGWIQGLYAQVGSTKVDLTACNNAEGSTIYEFPARIMTNSTGNDAMTVDVYALVTDDEAGTGATTDEKIATFNLTADGTIKSYVEQ